MRFKDIGNRVAELPHPVMGESRVPSPELIAFFVRFVGAAGNSKRSLWRVWRACR